jgi:hypothetical protein
MTTTTYTDRYGKTLSHLLLVARKAGLNLAADGSVAHVNKVLRLAGRDERLTSGDSYYYWRDGDSFRWQSVYVYRCADAALIWWLEQAAEQLTINAGC